MILHTSDDLDLELIARSGQCFRWGLCEDGSYRIISGRRAVYISKTGDGSFELECDENEAGYWHDYLDLDESYRSIRHRIDKELDPFLWEAADREKGIRILRQDPWETLVSFIISQNRNIPAIQRSIERLSELSGDKLVDIRGKEYYAFPSPEAVAEIDESGLKACSLGYRCAYVHSAAEAVLNGSFDPESLCGIEYNEAVEELIKLNGVGPKVASCVALFGLHQLDAFPKDVWIKRILEDKYPGGYPFERYSPYNGVYQQYMFAYYRNDRKE